VTIELAWDVEVPTCLEGGALVRAAQAALEHGGRPEIDLELVVLSDAALAELHGRYLGDDSPTDVMAFDLSDEHGGAQGEVYVSLDCARRVASERGVDLERELALYVVHGCLHLCGHDDHDEGDRERMRSAERAVLASLGHANDSAPHDR